MVKRYMRLFTTVVLFFISLPALAQDIRGPFRPIWYEESRLNVHPSNHNIVFYLEGSKISLENRGKDSSCIVLTDKAKLHIIPVPYGRVAISTLDGNILFVQCSNTIPV
jgi:hypothetical protein